VYRIIFLFFFLSGFSSLVFEVIWSRMLQQVFGTTSFAISTLLTAFMAGLALGSWLGGRLADWVPDKMRAYGILEASVGAFALSVPLLLEGLPLVYGLLFEHFIGDFYLFSLLRFAAVFAILIVPTTLMGATLPLISQWVAERNRLFQGHIGLLYGTNTLGACAGCLLAGFVFLPTFGLSTTNTTFATVGILLGSLIIATGIVLRRLDTGQKPASDSDAQDLDNSQLADIIGGTSRAEDHPNWALRASLIAFGLTGAVAMAYQVLWTRAYLMTLGSSTYSFTLVLTAVLVGIGLGSAAMSPFLKRIGRPVFWFSAVQFGVAASAAISFFTLNQIPAWLLDRLRQPVSDVGEVYLFQFALVALVVFAPSFLQGMSFPLVVRAVTERVQDTASDVGNAYAYNTTGAIIGSFAAGFILMPWLGLQGAIAAVTALNIAIAVGLAALELTARDGYGGAPWLALCAAVTTAIFVAAPPLDEARLTSGAFRAEIAQNITADDALEDHDPEILFYEDGLTSTISVERRGDTLTLKANGKPEASDSADMPTQILVGLLPFIIRSAYPDIEAGGERAAMIGYGSGVTAGASLQWPLAELDVVEIESEMIGASRHFEHVNHRPLDDHRLNLVESDGRNYLEYTPETFDIIVSEPSNPWISGVSSLFTVEFFERAKQRLEPGGLYAQWVQLYEMEPDNVRTVFRTFDSVFDHVQAFSTTPKSADVVLIGSKRPLPFGADGYRDSWQIESVRDELQRADVHSAHDLYGLLFMNHRQLADFAGDAPLNTDDNGLLEYSAPRDVLMPSSGSQFFTDWYFGVDDYGDPRPYLDDWPDRWTPEQIAALARAVWISGKPELSRQLLDDAGYSAASGHSQTDAPPPISAVLDVLQAAEQELDVVAAQHWPDGAEDLRRSGLAALESSDIRSRALEHLDESPEEYSEYGAIHQLYRALLERADRDYRSAEERLDDLYDSGDLADEPLFYFTRAQVLEIRRRYREAFEAYQRFSQLVAEESGED